MKSPAFELTTITIAQIGNKLDDVQALEFLLNSNIVLSVYGADVEEILAIFTVASPESESQEAVVNYEEGENLLELILPLGYAEIAHASREKAMEFLRSALLNALSELASYPPSRDFDFAALYADVKKLIA